MSFCGRAPCIDCSELFRRGTLIIFLVSRRFIGEEKLEVSVNRDWRACPGLIRPGGKPLSEQSRDSPSCTGCACEKVCFYVCSNVFHGAIPPKLTPSFIFTIGLYTYVPIESKAHLYRCETKFTPTPKLVHNNRIAARVTGVSSFYRKSYRFP